MNDTDNNQESVLSFPCQFPIKAMGKSGAELEQAVLEIVRRYVPDIADSDIVINSSKNGNYISMTLTITAHSKQQLDEIYRELTACRHVLYAL